MCSLSKARAEISFLLKKIAEGAKNVKKKKMWRRTRPWFLKKCCSSRCTMTGGEVCQGIVCTEDEFSIIIFLLLTEACRFQMICSSIYNPTLCTLFLRTLQFFAMTAKFSSYILPWISKVHWKYGAELEHGTWDCFQMKNFSIRRNKKFFIFHISRRFIDSVLHFRAAKVRYSLGTMEHAEQGALCQPNCKT